MIMIMMMMMIIIIHENCRHTDVWRQSFEN